MNALSFGFYFEGEVEDISYYEVNIGSQCYEFKSSLKQRLFEVSLEAKG